MKATIINLNEYGERFESLKEIIIKYGKKEYLKGFLTSKMNYIDNSYFLYNDISKNIKLYHESKLLYEIKPDKEKSDIPIDILIFYNEVLKMELGLGYDFSGILD